MREFTVPVCHHPMAPFASTMPVLLGLGTVDHALHSISSLLPVYVPTAIAHLLPSDGGEVVPGWYVPCEPNELFESMLGDLGYIHHGHHIRS